MLISEREAARRLARHGRSLSASQHLLSTGIAGQPVRTAVATLYDQERVDGLVGRPHVDPLEFERAFPVGTLVARLPRGREFDVDAAWSERADVMAGPWRISDWGRLHLTVTLQRRPGYPLLLSVAGHVLGGATVTGMSAASDGVGTCFALEAPGEWIEAVIGRRLRGRRGPQVELVGWTTAALGPG